MSAAPYPRHARPGVVLATLLLVYSFNFLDRQLLAILATPVKQDLRLSDGQLGMLGGLAFAALYSVLAVPLATLADRTSRSGVVAASLAVWSGFTALCGIAGSFAQLFAFRLGVGVGEAGGVAPSHALIADAFPAERRARALAIYSLGIPLGAAAAMLLGGAIAEHVAWRWAFVVVGIAGLVLAPFVRRLVPDTRAGPVPGADRPAAAATLAPLLRKPAFWLLSLGAAAGSVIGYGIAFWLPSLMGRSFGLSLAQTGRFLAALLLLGGVAGMLLGGSLADRWGRRDRRAFGWIPAVAYALSAPLFLAGLMADGWATAFALLIVPQALSYAWFGPVLRAIQQLAPADARATASASFLLVNNLIGLGLGSWLIGGLSDTLAPAYGTDALRIALAGGLLLYLLAAALMAAAARFLPGDWVD